METETFDQMVRSHQPLGMSIALSILGNPEDAEDALQNAMVKMWRAFSRFDPDRSFGPWFSTIVRNACRDFDRSRRAAKKFGGDMDAVVPMEAGAAYCPDAQLARTLAHDRVHRALECLSPIHREAIVMRDLDGMKYSEIAARLGVAEGTVGCRIFHARRALRRVLTRNR